MVHITKNTWYPDTCGCILEVTFDDELPDAERTVSFFSVIKSCSLHTPLASSTIRSLTTNTIERNRIKSEKMSMIRMLVDNNKRRNVDQVRKLHTQNNSDGSRSLFLPAQVNNEETGGTEMTIAEVPPIRSIEQSLDRDAETKLAFYDTLFNQPFSLVKDIYDSVLSESQLYNNALQVSLDNGPTSLYDMSGTSRVLKPTVTYNASWSGNPPNRAITISFNGVTLTNAQKTTIRNGLAAHPKTMGKVTLP